jgi:hypothetical protein
MNAKKGMQSSFDICKITQQISVKLTRCRLATVIPTPYKSQFEIHCRSCWPSGLRRGSVADWVLGLRVRIPPGAWMSVVECVLSDKRSVRRADHPSRGVILPWVCFM